MSILFTAAVSVAAAPIRASSHDFDPYAILALDRASHPTARAVKTAYRKLSLAFPPAYHPHYRDGDAPRIARLVAAYTVLRDPERRAMYDAEGTVDFDTIEFYNDVMGSDGTGADGSWWTYGMAAGAGVTIVLIAVAVRYRLRSSSPAQPTAAPKRD